MILPASRAARMATFRVGCMLCLGGSTDKIAF
jgi:hypothetical protein